MRQGGITVAVVYCNRCGCENPSDRGACLRCFNLLRWPTQGNICSNCGADNSTNASYCFNCDNAFDDAGPPDDWSLSAAIGLALGGAAEIGPAADEGDYLSTEEGAPAAVPDLDFEEQVAGPAGAAPPEPAMFEPVEAEEPPDIPPPPPGAAQLHEEERPESVDSEFAPLVPEDAAPEVDQTDLAALALELDTPPPPPKPKAAELAPPPPPPPAADSAEKPASSSVDVEEVKDEDDDDVFGGWALELDDKET
ncbi:MAG TPA: zinc ribbon domain-containing protein [Armatimonadota bacterium]|nr:zinc ribbon domain-containing protein [Armatimonadota bacterium]